MRFPPSFLEELKQKIPISDVIGRRITFDQRKSNAAKGDYWACCPFHKEDTPSFHCDDKKGFYHCFGCQASGDHIKFLCEHENLSFSEGVRKLANEAGVPIPIMDKQTQEKEKKKASLYEIMELATIFFQEHMQTPEGAKARAYLRDRGLSPKIQEEFKIGYAPAKRSALKEFLATKNVEKKQMEDCGLVVFGPDIPVSYDRFRDRIMFPINDTQKRIIAFGGRALDSSTPAKYINSPQTDLFSKSNVLYNYSKAREQTKQQDNLIIAEGYMDVIALHKAGFKNAVAPLGTALTAAQMQMAWRAGNNPYLCFDGDNAGINAAHRTIDTCLQGLKIGKSVRFAMMPEGKDPDDLIRETGREGFQNVLEQSIPLADMLWNRETQQSTFDTPDKRAELEQKFKTIINSINDENVRRHYQQDMDQRLADFFGNETFSGKKSFGEKSYYRSKPTNKKVAVSNSLMKSALVQKNSSMPPLRETALVITIANHPRIGIENFEEFFNIELTNPIAQNLKSALLNALSDITNEKQNENPKREDIKKNIEKLGMEIQFQKLQQQLKNNRMWQCLKDAELEDAQEGWKQALALHQKAGAMEKELKDAEQQFAENGDEESYEKLISIANELTTMDTNQALIEGFGEASGRKIRSL